MFVFQNIRQCYQLSFLNTDYLSSAKLYKTKAGTKLGKAKVAEIAEHLGVDTNSISSITSKLYKVRILKCESLSETPQESRGVQARYSYSLSDSQNL